jgi:hypothetical protein
MIFLKAGLRLLFYLLEGGGSKINRNHGFKSCLQKVPKVTAKLLDLSSPSAYD